MELISREQLIKDIEEELAGIKSFEGKSKKEITDFFVSIINYQETKS